MPDDPITVSPGPQFRLAMVLAIVADALQLVIFPAFVEGAFSPADDLLDFGIAAAMVRLLGWHWEFLPTFFVKLVPGVDWSPSGRSPSPAFGARPKPLASPAKFPTPIKNSYPTEADHCAFVIFASSLVAIVVALVPVAFLVPAPLVLIPPAMMLAPALFTRFPQLVPFVIRLPAVPPMMLNRFMQFVLSVRDPPLAALIDFFL